MFGEHYGGQLIVPSLWLSLWNAMMQVGFMAGSTINGLVADRFGRKFSMMAGAVIICIGVGVVYASDQMGDIFHRRIAFMFGKAVIGMGLSMVMVTSQIYNSEITPTKLRAPLLSILQFASTFGMLIAAVVAGHETKIGFQKASYRICFATQWALAGATIIAAAIVPESPAYYLRKGNIDGARKSVSQLYSSGTIDNRIRALQALLEQEREFMATTRVASYIECFKGSNWRRTRIVLYVNVMQQFLGVSFVANGTYFLITAGMTPSNSVMVLEIVSGLSMIANIVSWLLASTAGRRNSLIFGAVGVSLIWTSVGVSACFKGKPALW